MLVFALLSLASWSAPPPDYLTAFPLRLAPTGEAHLHLHVTGNGQLFEEVLELGRRRSYAGFLRELSARSPRLFRNHVLVFDSQSLQRSTPEHPRMILFDQGTMLSLREDPRRPEREVELLGWNPARGRFEAAELRFASPDHPGRLTRDPPACRACHGPELKPIWLPYDFWPGAYGANIGRPLSYAEAESYRSFLASRTHAPPHSAERYLDDSLTLRSGRESLYLTGVELFTEFVFQLHLASWQQTFRRNDPALRSILPALLAGGSLCGVDGPRPGIPLRANPEQVARALNRIVGQEVLGAPVVSARLEADYATLMAEKNRLLARYKRTFPIDSGTGLDFMPERLSASMSLHTTLRQLLLEAAGLPPLSFGTSPFEHLDRVSSPLNAEMYFAGVLGSDPDLLGPPWVREVSALNLGTRSALPIPLLDCQKLIHESQLRLSRTSLHPPGPTARPFPRPAVIPECASCHSPELAFEKDAPVIPFDRPAELGTLLRETDLRARIETRIERSGRGRMPPRAPLSSDEKTSFLQALDRIQSLVP